MSGLQRINIVLIGLRGSGKTTVGQLLASKLGWLFIDTDVVVQERAQKSIKEIFDQDGEPVFRALESEAVKQACRHAGAIIATGGGAILDPENIEDMRRQGVVIHLNAKPEELWQRIQSDPKTAAQRPALLAGKISGLDELAQLAEKRAECYAQARHLELQVGNRTPQALADEALQEARNLGLIVN